MTGRILFDILCAASGSGGCDSTTYASNEQEIILTMVVLPSLARENEFVARIKIQQAIYDKMERIKVLERIDDAETYQQIFNNLAKSLYTQVSGND